MSNHRQPTAARRLYRQHAAPVQSRAPEAPPLPEGVSPGGVPPAPPRPNRQSPSQPMLSWLPHCLLDLAETIPILVPKAAPGSLRQRAGFSVDMSYRLRRRIASYTSRLYQPVGRWYNHRLHRLVYQLCTGCPVGWRQEGLTFDRGLTQASHHDPTWHRCQPVGARHPRSPGIFPTSEPEGH